MTTDTEHVPQELLSTPPRLRAYLLVMALYFLGMVCLWMLGIESIYGHPTPFYALYLPVFDSVLVPVFVLLALAGFWWGQARWTHLPRKPAARAALTGLSILALAVLYALRQEQGKGDSAAAALLKDLGQLLPQLPPLLVLGAGVAALTILSQKRHWFTWRPSRKELLWFLAAVYLFLVLYSGAVAAIRGGFEGIADAYSRESYEYIGDIGKTSSIASFFSRYVELHDYLSMHSKVHPPGPVALLWLLSYLAGQSPLTLSIITIFFGSLGLIPLYLWGRQIYGEAAARTALLLYVLVPSVVLFTATSADILFTPFTLGALWLFERAIARESLRDAFLAGLLYGIMSVLSFSLIGIGVYFGLVGLWQCARGRMRVVIKVALVMALAAALFHGALYLWPGFDMIKTFQVSKHQFDLDQHHLDQTTPRLPAWTYRIWNPLTWFYFAGIPVSLLFLLGLRHARDEARVRAWIFLMTACALNFLYLARGEGERSALYLFPFLVLPAAHLLNSLGERQQTVHPLMTTLLFLAFQCWLTEAYFYTYW